MCSRAVRNNGTQGGGLEENLPVDKATANWALTRTHTHTHIHCSQQVGMGSHEKINYEVQCQVEGHEEGTITISQQQPVNSSHH